MIFLALKIIYKYVSVNTYIIMFIEILKYGFLAVFFATAVIGIASIPDWIKIPEWYRKRIFIALILEVIGVIIILFNQELITTNLKIPPNVSVSEANWVALDEYGVIVKPEVIIKTQDTLMLKKLGKQSYIEFKKLSGKIIRNGLSVRNIDSVNLGVIKALDLKQSGLFNSFKTAKGEITSTENYAYVKWKKTAKGRWKKKGLFIDPFELEVADYNEGTYYLIKNKVNGITVFDSRKSSMNLFSVDNRIIHFFEYKNIYYLLRITLSDLKHNEKYIHVINVRMEPTIIEK